MDFAIIADAVANGLVGVTLATGIPVTFGVLTVDTPEQAKAHALLSKARQDLEHLPSRHDASLIVGEGATATLARRYLEALLAGDRRRASQLILTQVEAGLSIKEVYLDVFQPVLREIGRLWHTNQITVAVEHFATAATQSTMSKLYRYLFTGEPRGRTMIATCVSGELHEVGMRMVADCFEMDGWDSYYLGANIPAVDVVATLRQRQASVPVSRTRAGMKRASKLVDTCPGWATEAMACATAC